MPSQKHTPRKSAEPNAVQQWLDFGWWLAGDAAQTDFAKRDGRPAIRYRQIFSQIMAQYFSDVPSESTKPASAEPAEPMTQDQMRAAMLPRFMSALQMAFGPVDLEAIAARESANFLQLVKQIRADFAAQASASAAEQAPRILHLEDSLKDAELIRNLLIEKWPGCQVQQVWTRLDYEQALKQGDFNLILSDNTMPGFDGLTALELARKHHPEKPFIFVSGTLGEERAVEAIQRGATDYVIKERPDRLVAAIHRALA